MKHDGGLDAEARGENEPLPEVFRGPGNDTLRRCPLQGRVRGHPADRLAVSLNLQCFHRTFSLGRLICIVSDRMSQMEEGFAVETSVSGDYLSRQIRWRR